MLNAQNNNYTNSGTNLLSQDNKLVLGGYGEVHFNQALEENTQNNGQLDVHRMVLLVGYNFSDKTQFVSELEFEHVKEVYVEQAFLQHKLSPSIQFRAGLMLVPMGIINEYHEPTTFNGVERPLIDKYIAPSTWREIGFGLTGFILPLQLKYQAYLVNGLNGYNGSGTFNGANGLRKGRQKGAESYITRPDFAAKVEYTGFSGLNIGFSGYQGLSESSLFNGLDKNNSADIATADSSQVGISMIGVDFRYQKSALQARGQFYYSQLSNTKSYNEFTNSNIGSALLGYYAELSYDVLKNVESDYSLSPFFRYEHMNTHHKVSGNTTQDLALKKNILTYGLTLKLNSKAVIKTDIQSIKAANASQYRHTFNAGIGVMF